MLALFFAHFLRVSVADTGRSCAMFTEINGGCEQCTVHYGDLNCGWCSTTKTCEDAGKTTCNRSNFYYAGNAPCGGSIPTPTPTPWPAYDAKPEFCSSLSGTWCDNCVTKNASMNCIWCHKKKQCVMGDAYGAFFLANECESFSYRNDDKCQGKIGKTSILLIRIFLALFIAVVTAVSIFGCYKVIRKPKQNENYQEVNN
jgi:hypothetical protein